MEEKYSNLLIQRVNELYHDLTNEEYHDSHPEIFNGERERWRNVANSYFTSNQPLKIIEIGSGTGFVPLTIGDILKPEDVFTCSDISANMLATAQRNISQQNFKCSFRYVKIEARVPLHLDFNDNSADIILMNSVLHHLQETDIFLRELDRILKKSGLLITAHEPNKYFFQNKFLIANYAILNSLTNPGSFVNSALKALRLKKIAGKIRKAIFKSPVSAQSEITSSINKVLKHENLINEELVTDEIEGMVDIKSEEGFKPDKLLDKFKVEYLDTYNHLFWVYLRSPANAFIKKYNSALRKIFPRSGSTFFLVLRKE